LTDPEVSDRPPACLIRRAFSAVAFAAHNHDDNRPSGTNQANDFSIHHIADAAGVYTVPLLDFVESHRRLREKKKSPPICWNRFVEPFIRQHPEQWALGL